MITSLDLHFQADKHLSKYLDKVERALERGKHDKAVKELDKVIEYLEREARKYEKQEDKGKDEENKHIMTTDADMLIEIIKEISRSLRQ